MQFDAKKIKAGLSLSKINNFTTCPLRGYVLNAVDPEEGLPIKEDASEIALVGRLVAVALADVRLKWLEHGVDTRVAMTYEGAIRKAIKEEPEGYTEEHVSQTMEIVQTICKMKEFLPRRETVARFWIEERLAFSEDWKRIVFKPGQEKWWGSAEQRAQTHFRYVHDLCYVDRDGNGYVQDDKSLGWKDQDPKQVQAGAFLLFKMLPSVPSVRISYNLLGPGRVQDCGTVTLDDVKGFPSWVDAKKAEIRNATEFPPIINRACEYPCGWRSRCPLHIKVAGELETIKPGAFRPPVTLEEAQALGLWILTGESVLKAAKAAAKAFVAQHGPVPLPLTGKEMRINRTTEWEGGALDALNTVGAALLAQGMSPQEAQKTILDTVTFHWSQVEQVTKKLWPYSGKGITGPVKVAHQAIRGPVEQTIRGKGAESPRGEVFTIAAEKET